MVTDGIVSWSNSSGPRWRGGAGHRSCARVLGRETGLGGLAFVHTRSRLRADASMSGQCPAKRWRRTPGFRGIAGPAAAAGGVEGGARSRPAQASKNEIGEWNSEMNVHISELNVY